MNNKHFIFTIILSIIFLNAQCQDKENKRNYSLMFGLGYSIYIDLNNSLEPGHFVIQHNPICLSLGSHSLNSDNSIRLNYEYWRTRGDYVLYDLNHFGHEFMLEYIFKNRLLKLKQLGKNYFGLGGVYLNHELESKQGSDKQTTKGYGFKLKYAVGDLFYEPKLGMNFALHTSISLYPSSSRSINGGATSLRKRSLYIFGVGLVFQLGYVKG